MSKEELIFASETEALQYLSNLTGKRVKVAYDKRTNAAKYLVSKFGYEIPQDLEESINEMSEQEQISIVRKNPTDIAFIRNPSEKVQLAAFEKGYQETMKMLVLNQIPISDKLKEKIINKYKGILRELDGQKIIYVNP